jgi:hypothetical protein
MLQNNKKRKLQNSYLIKDQRENNLQGRETGRFQKVSLLGVIEQMCGYVFWYLWGLNSGPWACKADVCYVEMFWLACG